MHCRTHRCIASITLLFVAMSLPAQQAWAQRVQPFQVDTSLVEFPAQTRSEVLEASRGALERRLDERSEEGEGSPTGPLLGLAGLALLAVGYLMPMEENSVPLGELGELTYREYGPVNFMLMAAGSALIVGGIMVAMDSERPSGAAGAQRSDSGDRGIRLGYARKF